MNRASAQAAITPSASRTSTEMRSTSSPSRFWFVAPWFDQRHHAGASGLQRADDGGSDESGCAGHDDPIALVERERAVTPVLTPGGRSHRGAVCTGFPSEREPLFACAAFRCRFGEGVT